MRKSSTPPSAQQEGSAQASTVFLIVLRGIFLAILMAVAWGFAGDERNQASFLTGGPDLLYIAFLGVGSIVIALDVFVPRKSLASISGLFFGLAVGMVVAYGFSLILNLLVTSRGANELSASQASFLNAIKLAIGVICCYLAVSFILQTKDDVRFVIPYVEFAKETKGARPLVLDTSVIVDGRIADIATTRIFESEIIIPRFVLHELQTIADSSDKLKRARGRRGLDMLNRLQANDHIEIRILDVVPERSSVSAGVDEMLVDLSLQLNGRVVTTDYNLNKIAQLRGVTVININDLTNALRPVVLPGEPLAVKIIKPGEEAGQGIGYLEDGTMVVAEGGRDKLGEMVHLVVTSVLQTSAGRMIFGRLDGLPAIDRRRPRPPDRGDARSTPHNAPEER